MTSLPLPRHGTLHLELGAARMRARVWRRRFALTRELAAGANPSDSRELALRAQQLLRPRYRQRLADNVDGLVTAAEARPAFSAGAPLRRREIGRCRVLIGDLAALLRSETTVAPRGVALALLLLLDPQSPAYAACPDGALRDAVADARAALEQRRWT